MKGNNVSIKGNVTRDCEVRSTPSGKMVVSWGIAWNRSRKNQSGEYEDVPHYFDCECWVTERQLDMIQGSLVKGVRCAITEAHLEYQSWESQGQKRSKVVVMVDDPISGMLVQAGNAQKRPQSREMYSEEDIPF